MGAKVVFEVDAKHAPAVAKMVEFQRIIDGTAKGFRDAFKAAKDGADTAAGGIGSLAAQIQKTALGMVGFGSALGGAYTTARLIGEEYSRMMAARSVADERKRASLPAYNKAILAVGKEYDLESTSAQALTRRGIQARGSNNAGDYFDLLANMQSARGNISPQMTHEASVVAAEFAGKRQLAAEEAAQLGGALMDLANTAVDRGEKPDFRGILGGISSGFGASRSTSIEQFAHFDMRAIQGLMRHSNASFRQAVGIQGVVGEKMPDPTGRRAANLSQSMFQDIEQAYAELANNGIIGGKFEQFQGLDPFQKLDMITGNTQDAKWMRLKLMGVRTPDKDMRAYAMHGAGASLGITEAGMIQGESGAREIGYEFLTPGNKLLPLARKFEAQTLEGQQAAEFYNQQMRGRLTGPSQRYGSDVAAEQGAQAVTDWLNTKQAQSGAVQKFADDVQLKTGKGWLATKASDIYRGLRFTEPGQEKADSERAAIAQEGINRILDRQGNLPWYAKGFDVSRGFKEGVHSWTDPIDSLLGTNIGGTSPWRTRAEANLDGEDKETVESLRSFIREIENNRQRSAMPDQSSTEVKQSLDGLKEQLALGQKMDVTIRDPYGRELQRQTSQTRPLERLYDAPLEPDQVG